MTLKKPDKIERLVSLIFTMQRIVRQSGKDYNKFDPHLMLRIAVLKFINEEKQSTMKDIASYLNITAPSATSLVNNLVKSGLVVREKNKGDMRVTRISLSRKGNEVIKEMMETMSEKMRQVFMKLDDKEITDFIRILEHLNEVNQER